MNDRFLAHLVKHDKISPGDLKKINDIFHSPWFFAKSALSLGFISKTQYEKIATVSADEKTAKDIAKYLLAKRILTTTQLAQIGEKHKNDLDLVKNIISELDIIEPARLDPEVEAFSEQIRREAQERRTPLAALDILLVCADKTFEEVIREKLEPLGHNVTVHNDAIEAGKAVDENEYDLVVSELELEIIDGIQMVGQMLNNYKKLYTAVFGGDTDSYTLPNRLYIEERFFFGDKNNIERHFDEYIEKIVRKKSGMQGLADKLAAADAPDFDQAEIIRWMRDVRVEYSKDGIYLEIDPEKVPRPHDQHRISESDKQKYKGFIEAVNKKLADMKIEKIDTRAVEMCVWYPWKKAVKIAPPQEQSKDAAASFSLSEDGRFVLMDYTPPIGRGRRLNPRNLVFKVQEVQPEFCILNSTIENVCFSDRPVNAAPVAEKRDASVEIRISPDGTEAFMTLRRPYGGKPIRLKQVRQLIKDMGIKHGLDKNLIKEFCESSFWDREICIASGRLPVDGRDGSVRNVELDDYEERRQSCTGVNHRIVQAMEKVYAGDPIIIVEPPTDGIAGINVMGEEIPAKPGKPVKFATSTQSDTDATLILGDNTELVLGGTRVIATIDGMVKRDGRYIDVSPVYEVDGDVDYSVGNLDISGDLLIRGSVLSKFEVKASGDIHILGSVEDAVVQSGGSIYIEQGVYGNEKAIIYAANSVTAKSIEQANVFSRGSITAHSNISHSTLVAYGNIETTAKNGFIVGGLLRAGFKVATSRLGSQAGTITTLDIGTTINMADEIENLKSYMLRKISLGLAIANSKSDADNEKEKEEKDDEALKGTRYEGIHIKSYNLFFLKWIDNFIRKNKNRVPVFRPDARTVPYRITIENHTYPGVYLRIKGMNFVIKNELVGKRNFSLSGETIVESV